VAWPLYRHERRLSPSLVAGVGTVLAVSAAVYSMVGTPVPPETPDVGEMIASLEARLAEHPDDVDGWTMLGRSWMHLENYPEAVRALGQAVELEGSGNAQTLVLLGEAVLGIDSNALNGRAGQLFENAI